MVSDDAAAARLVVNKKCRGRDQERDPTRRRHENRGRRWSDTRARIGLARRLLSLYLNDSRMIGDRGNPG
jgi:hypothetical protein